MAAGAAEGGNVGVAVEDRDLEELLGHRGLGETGGGGKGEGDKETRTRKRREGGLRGNRKEKIHRTCDGWGFFDGFKLIYFLLLKMRLCQEKKMRLGGGAKTPSQKKTSPPVTCSGVRTGFVLVVGTIGCVFLYWGSSGGNYHHYHCLRWVELFL